MRKNFGEFDCCGHKYDAYTSINLHDSPSLIPSPTQMDSLTGRKVCGEVGTGAASLTARFSTRGAIGARRPPGLGWTPWSEEERKTGTSRTATPPRLSPSETAGTSTKTAAPPAPRHRTLRKRAISWDSPSRCPPSSDNTSPRRSGGGRSGQTGG